jgi:eukaryotic-like serine/threonine-protein kinase
MSNGYQGHRLCRLQQDWDLCARCPERPYCEQISRGWWRDFRNALDAAEGRYRWHASARGFIDSSPTVAGGAVYIGSGDQQVYKFDADSGKSIWEYRTGGWIFFSSPAVADGIVYIGSTDGKVYAIDSVTGKEHWIRPLGRRRIKGSPVVNSGTVYIGSLDHHFCALNAATGDFQWAYNAGSGFTANPVVANNLVYIGCNDGNVYAFHAEP